MDYPKFSHKTPHLKGKKHQLDPNLDLKQLVHHATVQYVDRDVDGDVDVYDNPKKKVPDESPAKGNIRKTTDILMKKQKGEIKHTKRGMAFESSNSNESVDEACWKGYKQVGMKKKGSKVVPNCVPEEADLKEATRIPSKNGNLLMVVLTWKGSTYAMRVFFPQSKIPNRREVEEQIQKIYPGCKVSYFKPVEREPGEPFLQIENWQKVNKSDKTDGMSQKAVNTYRRENPGSKLKTAVTEKDPGPERSKRKKSFCARSEGQKNMHNIDCSKDPDKAICKARKRWRC
jgi:hypothetical protein